MARRTWCLTLVAVCLAAARGTGQVDRPAATTPASLSIDLVTDRWMGDFDGIVQRRRLRLLTPYSRTHYLVDRGVQRGIVYDFGMQLEREINRRLGTRPATKVHVVFVPTPRSDLIAALMDGRGDVIASNLTVTADPPDAIAFTVPGQTNVAKILVTGPGAPPIRTVRDLAGVEIAVREGGAELDSLLTFNAALQAMGAGPARVRRVPPVLEDDDLLEMVAAGLMPATVVDDVVGSFWSGALPSLTLRPDIVVRPGTAIAWAVRRDNPKLLAALNPIVEANRIGTRFGNATLRAYLRRGRPVRPATAAPALARFRALTAVFERYGRRYDLDPLLMMAQGFQESGLDQQARSPKGAIGVMQMMPDTGRGLDVGDVRQLEANVHAGVKYMRLLIDRHVDGKRVAPLDRALLAFAAYNCGPTRLRGIRRETVRRGLDPDRWFGHVERTTGEIVGRQTVDYVANIYKYYVAYTLALESSQPDVSRAAASFKQGPQGWCGSTCSPAGRRARADW
jgi:membrane-bound lytic murein transglycosylase MltF